jgi:rare lipoprotein A
METYMMRRALIAAVAIATLLTFATRSTSFAAAREVSPAGTETGIATCYSRRLSGHRTTSGKRYNPHALTAAHAKIPIGTRVKVTNLKNGRSVVVLVNDHMPSHLRRGIIIDISRGACRELRFGRGGEAKVELQVLSATR